MSYRNFGMLLIIGSGLFTTQIFISPVYVVFILCTLALLGYILKSKSLYFSHLAKLTCLVMLYFGMTQLFLEPDANTVINVLFALVFFLVSLIMLPTMAKENILTASRGFINLSIVLLVIEAYWRITHPQFDSMLASGHNPGDVDFFELGFYAYKINSIMYEDSNFVGIQIIATLFFSYYLSLFYGERYKKQLLCLGILCILSFSRAAIMSAIIFTLIYKFIFIKEANQVAISRIRLTVSLVFVAVCVVIAISLVTDASFLSKFEIVDAAKQILFDAKVTTLLFGVGFGNSVNKIGIGAHNMLVAYLLESGIAGLSSLGVLWGTILVVTGFEAAFIMFPFLLTGMSLAGHAIPYLYMMFTVISCLRWQRTCNHTKTIECED